MQGSHDNATTLHCKQAVSAEAADFDAGDPPNGGFPVSAYAGLTVARFRFPFAGPPSGRIRRRVLSVARAILVRPLDRL